MGTIGVGMPLRSRGAFMSWLVPALLVALLAAAGALAAATPAGAAAKPAKPTAKTPVGTVSTAKPIFTWTRAARATRYELRVYQGSSLLLKRTGLRKRSWTSGTALLEDVGFTWKVRGKNARGSGRWSRSLAFTIASPSPSPPPSSAKAIIAFSIPGQKGATIIDETLHTVAVTMPFGAALSALAPTIAISGASVSPASGAAQDFSSPRTYTVTAATARPRPTRWV